MVLTRKHITDLKTEAGGYNYNTIEALGESTPPTSGWIERIMGKEITKKEYDKALKHSNAVKYKRLPDNDILKPTDLHIVYSINGELKQSFKYWRLDVAELVLERMGADYWEIGLGCDPYMARKI